MRCSARARGGPTSARPPCWSWNPSRKGGLRLPWPVAVRGSWRSTSPRQVHPAASPGRPGWASRVDSCRTTVRGGHSSSRSRRQPIYLPPSVSARRGGSSGREGVAQARGRDTFPLSPLEASGWRGWSSGRCGWSSGWRGWASDRTTEVPVDAPSGLGREGPDAEPGRARSRWYRSSGTTEVPVDAPSGLGQKGPDAEPGQAHRAGNVSPPSVPGAPSMPGPCGRQP